MIDVHPARLDDLLPARVDFIKIDAEGPSGIWQGTSTIIETNPQHMASRSPDVAGRAMRQGGRRAIAGSL